MFHRYDVIDRSDGQDAMRNLDEHRRKDQAAEESRSTAQVRAQSGSRARRAITTRMAANLSTEGTYGKEVLVAGEGFEPSTFGL